MSSERLQGGALGGVEDLYREVILDHFKTPKNKGVLPGANAKAEGVNPLCGDQLSMTVLLENGKVTDLRFQGHGCAISQSAASMLTDAVKGKTVAQVLALLNAYKNMFGVQAGPTTVSEEELGDLISLEGVKKYPVRIKCALLSCNTLLESIEGFRKLQ
jgi:nitrogen fixation protein NifU and related proteins